MIGRTLALGVLLLSAPALAAEAQGAQTGLARELIVGCLKPPSDANLARLASAAVAKPYSRARIQAELELKTRTVVVPEQGSGRDQRSKVTATEFQGWDLPGRDAGTLEYRAQQSEFDLIERSSGQSLTPVRVSASRSCTLQAPVANARAIFEFYEGLSDAKYGLRISANRQWVDVFMFDADHYDIELSFDLEEPLAGLPPGESGRVILPDGGPRFLNGAMKGVPTTPLTRAAVLKGLDRPATMTLMNMTIERVREPLVLDRQTPR